MEIQLQDGLVGHWPFRGDSAGKTGQDHGITFGVRGPNGEPASASSFNGIDSRLEIADHPGLQFGTGDFSIAVWIHTEAKTADVVGDLVSKFDPDAAVVFVDHDKSFEGGQNYGRFKNEPSRIAYCARSKNPQIKATLALKSVPNHAALTVGGMDDNATTKAPIELLVNGVSVFKGDSQFPDEQWAARAFPIPDGALKVGANEVVLRNTGDSSLDSNPPWFAVTFFKISSNSKGKE